MQSDVIVSETQTVPSGQASNVSLALLVVFAATTCLASDVSGVVASEAGMPIAGATITLTPDPAHANAENRALRARTGEDGRYLINDVPFGDYAISAASGGFLDVTYRPIRIERLAFAWDFVLRLAPVRGHRWDTDAYLVGTIRSGDRARPGVRICLQRAAKPYCVLTNTVGQYEIRVPPGEYVVTLEDAGIIIWKKSLDLSPNGDYRDAIGPLPPVPKD